MKPLAGPIAARPLDFDLLRVPLLGRLLHWRHLRTALQTPLLVAAALLVYDGFFGPQLAPRNLAGVAPWVQWRGLTVLALLLVGSLFCMACPFLLTRRLAKRLLPANRSWPKRLRGKLVAAALLILFFWFYEAFDPWARPWLTSSLALAYFAGAFAVDGFFRGAAFCKYLCPIGQFNFVNSLVSPFEVKVRSLEVCRACATKDCIKGRHGCELGLFQQRKAGNMDCTFCLDCVHACPHDNVGMIARVPAAELLDGRRRSGIGRLGERTDLAVLVLVLVFGAFLNAFGMVGPFSGLERWLAGVLGTEVDWIVLGIVFLLGLVALPLLVMGGAAAAARALSGSAEPLIPLATRYSYALVPLGFGMWLAHYGFHFLTGAFTLVPVAQSFSADVGLPWLGEPRWDLGPLVPASWLLPLELLFLEAGLLGSLVVGYRLALHHHGEVPVARRAFLPWALLAAALFTAGVWLMLQPMEMRGAFGPASWS